MAHNPQDNDTTHLLGTTDPRQWAQSFREIVLAELEEGRAVGVDEDTLIGWFANAMQAKESSILGLGTHKLTTEELHTLVFEAAGAATAPCLSAAPDLIMPSEEVVEGVNRVLAEKGLPTSEDRASGDAAVEKAFRSLSDGGEALGGSPG